jgi:tRNA pseudouridine55 synthase
MFLYIDKPKGITSHDAVDRVRKLTGERRVGHAGTLDPNATGLLIVGVGRESTRELDKFLKKDKEYEAEVILGEERDTDDIEGNIVKKDESGKVPETGEIENALKGFIGKVKQVPPLFSAIKVDGKEAYKRARKGETVKYNEREVNIYSIKIIDYKYPVLNILCKVGSGTYIRSIARDLGRKIGTFAYLGNLRRTKIGNVFVKDATPLNDLGDIIKKHE